MTEIRNKAQLIENGETRLDKKARRLALESLEAALNAADPKQMLRSRLFLDSSTLRIDGYVLKLEKLSNVYVVGGGKASGSMAEALEQILGRRITDGSVNVPHGTKNKTSRIRLHGASHPVPDEAGVEGTRSMLEMVENTKASDLVICLISGGGSSLMPLPRGNVSLVDKEK
jgi:glycerate-2-kinase